MGDAVDLHTRLTYVPGEVELWPELTDSDAIELLGRLRGGLDLARGNEQVERLDLDPTKKGRTFSKGNRQKATVVAALLPTRSSCSTSSPPVSTP